MRAGRECGGAHFTPLSSGTRREREREREREGERERERERESDELCPGGFDTPIVFSRSTATPTGKDSERETIGEGRAMPGVFERRTRRLIRATMSARTYISRARARARRPFDVADRDVRDY